MEWDVRRWNFSAVKFRYSFICSGFRLYVLNSYTFSSFCLKIELLLKHLAWKTYEKQFIKIFMQWKCWTFNEKWMWNSNFQNQFKLTWLEHDTMGWKSCFAKDWAHIRRLDNAIVFLKTCIVSTANIYVFQKMRNTWNPIQMLLFAIIIQKLNNPRKWQICCVCFLATESLIWFLS